MKTWMSCSHVRRYCPHCQHEINSATQFWEFQQAPRPGDMAFCFYCGRLSTYAVLFNEHTVLVALSSEREAEVALDPRVISMHAAWLDFRRREGRR